MSASLPWIGGDRSGALIPPSILLAISIGAFALAFGSLLPDLDGRGRIRWIIGPMLGAMALVPPLSALLVRGDLAGTLLYLGGEGAVIFLSMSVLGYVAILVPLKHRGIMHRGSTSLVFAMAVGAYSLFSAGLDMPQFAVVCLMAFTGYAWHLALDGSLLKG